MPIVNEQGVLKLPNKDRTTGGARTQNSNRHRRKYVKPTEEQLEKKKQERDEFQKRFNGAIETGRKAIAELMTTLHDAVPERTEEWWYQYMMQQPKYTSNKRKISRWHAFTSIEIEKRNKALLDSNGEDAHCDRVSTTGLMKVLSEQWALLSEQEKDVLTAEKVRELEERRDDRAHGVRNLSLAKFMDVRETFNSLYNQMENLHDRTGVEIYFAAVRAEHTAYNKPVIYYSSDRVRTFVEMITNASLAENGVRMEAYCIGGVDGIVSNQIEKTLLLKGKLASLIITKLRDTCKRGTIKRMYYDSFDQQITAKHGVVIENWPIPTFHSPSNMSFIEAEMVLASFENNTTRFRSLPEKEWVAWKQQYFAATPDADNDTANAEIAAREEEDDPEPVRILGPACGRVGESTPSSTTIQCPDITPTTSSGSRLAHDNHTAVAGEKRASEGDHADNPPKKARPAPLAVNFINSVTPASGGSFQVPIKARKTRSDKGKTRKKGSKATPATTQSPAAIPATTPTATPTATPAVMPTATPAVMPTATPATTPAATPATAQAPTATPAVTPTAPTTTQAPGAVTLGATVVGTVTPAATLAVTPTRRVPKPRPKKRVAEAAPEVSAPTVAQDSSRVVPDIQPVPSQAVPLSRSPDPAHTFSFYTPSDMFPSSAASYAPEPENFHPVSPPTFSFEPSSTFQFNVQPAPSFEFTPMYSLTSRFASSSTGSQTPQPPV